MNLFKSLCIFLLQLYLTKKRCPGFLASLSYSLLFSFSTSIFAQGISTGVTFNWADTQANLSDPATIESIIINGKEYNTFVVPSNYEMTRLGPGGADGNNIWLNGTEIASSSDESDWNSKALSAYQAINLNHYFQSSDNGDNFCEDFGAVATTDAQIQTITYNPGIPSNPDGILAVTERGGNNCQYIELVGIRPGGTTEEILGTTFVRNQGNLTGVGPQEPPRPNSDYWSSGRNNENNQIIGIALFELSEIAPVGSTITAVRYFAATRDNGDGKFFLMQTYAVDDNFESDFDEVFTGDVSANDNIPEGSVYTYYSSVPPFNGTLIVNPDGSFTYTPNAGFVGTDVFEVEVCLPAPNNTVCNVSTVTMSVNPEPSTLSIDDASATEGDNIAFTITNSIPLSYPITIDLSYTNINTTNLDYNGPTSVILPANASSITFDVAATDDDLIEVTETFEIFISTSEAVNISDEIGVGSILDNDGGAGTGISFDSTDVIVDEDAGTATFTVRLSGNVPGGFTLDYATANGSAIAPGDFTAVSGQLTFLGNDNESFDIVVPIIDDTLIEATEGYAVNLSNLSTGLISINTPQANGGIVDNDGGAGTGISFDSTDVIVDEDAGTATFTVRLTGNVPGGFTLDYATANGSAIAPGDFTAVSGQLTFLGNDNEAYDITVPIFDDTLIEPTEGYIVNLSNLSTTLIAINTPQANGGIVDNDGGAGTGISFDSTDVIVDEDAGTATFTVRLSGNVPGGFTLDYATANGSAIAPGDFTAVSGQLTFLGNDNESFDIVVTIIDDTLIEATEGYAVNLSNLSTGLISINTPQANGGIVDNDGGAGTGISFDSTDVIVDEDAGTATFTVRLSGNVPGGFTLDYATANGSAIAPGDFTAVSGQLTFLGNDNESFDIVVPIIDDTLIEATEGYAVNLSNLSTGLISINTPQANGGIVDNDGGAGTGISFDSTDVIVDEDAGTATFTVRLSGNVPGGFTLDYATANGSAIAPGDFTAVSGQLTFLGNDNESFDIVVPIIDDTLIEATEGYAVNLSNLSTGLISINTPQANGGIVDNDGGAGTGISFDSTDVIVDEDAGTATFTVRLSGNVPGGFTLDYATANGSAIAPGDFTAVSGQLTFLGNDNESFDIVVTIIDDTLIEATEGYAVNLSNLSTGLISINTPQANGGIVDNDGGAGTGISFDSTDVIVDEDAGTATFTVRLSGNVPGGFTLDYATANGSAIAPGDFTAVSGQLTFLGNDNESFDIVVPIIDDTLIEATEGYAVNLSNLSTGLISINTPQANGGIVDNDDRPGIDGISFVQTDVTVTEQNPGDTVVATFEVRLTGNYQDAFEIAYETMFGTATDTDFEAQTGTLAFDGTDGQIQTITITILNDLIIEPSEAYTVLLTGTTNPVVTINTPEANGTIIDDDMRTIVSNDYVTEYMILCGEEMPEIPELTFSGGCGDYQVEFTEVEDSADASSDYMIIRTWNVTDACGNKASFEQLIMVMQLEEALITIDICVEDEAFDLTTYLPENFDTNGTFTVTQGVALLDGNFFNPNNLELGEYIIAYSSTVGSCTYLAEYTINVNADCVACSEEDVIVSKAVTPNGDNFNDLFEITGAENCLFIYDVMIFNRWGNKVFEANDYQNDWGGIAPNGSFGTNGTLPSGTYYYIINVRDRLDLKPINGYIYLGTK